MASNQNTMPTFKARGYLCIEVLPFLKGRKLNDIAYAYIHALRPSSVRVSDDGWLKADARTWRVTVHTLDGIITTIEQEVEVGLPDGIEHGYDLSQKINRP